MREIPASFRTEKLPVSGRLLWLAVIKQAFEDATSSPLLDVRAQAREWLRNGGTERDKVCALADVNPESIVALALKRFGWNIV
jgi:cell division inhibitor SulA